MPWRDASPWERSACNEIGSPSLHTRNRSGWDEHKRAAVTITAAVPRRNGYRLRFGDEAAHSVWNLIDGFTADMFECAYKSRAEYRYREGLGLGFGLARGAPHHGRTGLGGPVILMGKMIGLTRPAK